MAGDVEIREGKWGERMIELKVRFFTDGIVEGRGRIRPKHAWSAGEIRMGRNESHGISPQEAVLFHSLMEIPAKLEQTLIAHGVQIHAHGPQKKYLAQD